MIDFGIKHPSDFSPIPDRILEETLIPQFERTVQKHADHMAIKDENYCLTYRELNNAINHLADLILKAVGSDRAPVAFMLEDEVLSIVTLMAILKTGKPLVGLHHSNSVEQLKSFLVDSDALLLIASSKLKETAQKITSGQNQVQILYFDEMQIHSDIPAPEYYVAPNDLFGIFYTSGSTGKPKGVMWGHLQQSHITQYMANSWGFSPSDRITLFTSVYFGASYPSLMGALLNGGLLCIFNLKTHSAQEALDWLIKEEITVMRSTPSIFRTIFGLASDEIIFSKLRFMTISGEPSTGKDIQLFKAHTIKDCVIINNYASTESGNISHYPIGHSFPDFQGFSPGGFPTPGKEIMLIDDNGEIAKNGEEGEIAVKSRYLSLGYWKQPELTAQKFQIDPTDPNLRICFTGDRGRWLEGGILEVLGRKDTQVKIRGYRVELASIDQALRNLSQIEDAATIVHTDMTRGQRLVAYFSTRHSEKISISELRNDLSEQLPSYMIPSTFVQLDFLPRTASGKLARPDLPEPSRQRPDLTTTYLAPQTEMEIRIAEIWKKMLGLEQIGVQDNFFELGGDSLLALEMTLEVEKEISKSIPQAFFTNPSIAHLVILLFEQPIQPSIQGDSFQVESYKGGSATKKYKKKKIALADQISKAISRRYSFNDFDTIIDRLIGKYIASKTYPAAVEWALKWSQNSFVQNTLYAKRHQMFASWIHEFREPTVQPADVFHLSILNNLHFRIPRHSKKQVKGSKSRAKIQGYKDSKYLYWRSLGEILDAISLGQMSEYFPIQGMEHLEEAYKKGKGVILVTFHGVPTPGRFFPLEKLLGLEKIETISYHTPVWQSTYQTNPHDIPETAAFTLNAEIALFGQRQLQRGKVINMVSDTNDLQGKTYKTFVAGRVYQIKGGFAELAINTGAAIVPHFRYCLPDGKLMLHILPELHLGKGSRQDQVEDLIHQYAAFIEHSWQAHPEAMHWHKIKKHLKRSTS